MSLCPSKLTPSRSKISRSIQFADFHTPSSVATHGFSRGSFTFTGNSGSLFSGYPMHVTGSFTYSGNTGPVLDRSGQAVGVRVLAEADIGPRGGDL